MSPIDARIMFANNFACLCHRSPTCAIVVVR
jgi:hypothetical protein